MIAAAVAALTASAMAEAAAYAGLYKFTASLKTTTNASKTDKQTETFYINLGWDAKEDGTVWWRALKDEYGWETEKAAKAFVNKLIEDYKADIVPEEGATLDDFLEAIGYDKEELDELERPASNKKNTIGTYNCKDPKNGKWCSQFTVKKTTTLTDCYRKAGSKKINALVVEPTCCDAEWEFYEVKKFVNLKTQNGYVEGTTIANYLNEYGLTEEGKPLAFTTYWRFGGVSLDNASKVEALGYVGTDDYNEVGSFAFGGQGTRVKKDYTALQKLSGSIIGTLPNPGCYICCDQNTPACFFKCTGEKYTANPREEEDIELDADAEEPGTVAYGTFTLNYYKTAKIIAE